jgi:hypothetical protein
MDIELGKAKTGPIKQTTGPNGSVELNFYFNIIGKCVPMAFFTIFPNSCNLH